MGIRRRGRFRQQMVDEAARIGLAEAVTIPRRVSEPSPGNSETSLRVIWPSCQRPDQRQDRRPYFR